MDHNTYIPKLAKIIAIKEEVASLLVESIIDQGFEVVRLDVSTISLASDWFFTNP